MTAEDNIKLVQQQFESFGRGAVDMALAAVADQVGWRAPVSVRPGSLPWAGRRQSRQQVADYFRDLTSAVRPQPFQDLTFTAAADRVVVEGRNRGTVLATGQPLRARMGNGVYHPQRQGRPVPSLLRPSGHRPRVRLRPKAAVVFTLLRRPPDRSHCRIEASAEPPVSGEWRQSGQRRGNIRTGVSTSARDARPHRAGGGSDGQ